MIVRRNKTFLGDPEIATEEWDFNQVKTDEIYACWEWEFWRELLRSKQSKNLEIRRNAQLACDRIDEYRRQQKKADGDRVAGFWIENPFLKIPESERFLRYQGWKKLVYPQLTDGSPGIFNEPSAEGCHSSNDLESKLNAEVEMIRFEQESAVPSQETLFHPQVFGEWDENICGQKPSLFSVDWTMDDRTLLRCFKKFIEKKRVETIPQELVPESRGDKYSTKRSNLIGLAILRLSRYFKVEQMRCYVAKKKGINPKDIFGIGDNASISRTKKRAEDVLRNGLMTEKKSLQQ